MPALAALARAARGRAAARAHEPEGDPTGGPGAGLYRPSRIPCAAISRRGHYNQRTDPIGSPPLSISGLTPSGRPLAADITISGLTPLGRPPARGARPSRWCWPAARESRAGIFWAKGIDGPWGGIAQPTRLTESWRRLVFTPKSTEQTFARPMKEPLRPPSIRTAHDAALTAIVSLEPSRRRVAITRRIFRGHAVRALAPLD